MFKLVDYAIFGLFLLLSLSVGLYHGIMPKFRAQDHSKTAEFLTGGRQLPILPVCLSLLTTFTSGIGLLSTPAEIYTRGFTWGIYYLTGAFAFPFIGYFFIPVFYKLKFLNAYEYFEIRFHSALLRRIATVIFLFNTLIIMAAVIYAPSIALAKVTGVSVWSLISIVGVVGTAYSTAGGIKAVIWTDTLQVAFIYVGLAIILVKGTAEAGGILNVFSINEETGRFSDAIFKLKATPLQYNSAWLDLFGGPMFWISLYGLNQMAIQRYCSMPSLKDAQIVLTLTVPAIYLIGCMTSYLGLMMAAYFSKCNPLALGEVQTIDQLTILMASRILDNLPGMPGMFLACLFSATLSTVSSGINSLTACVWEDFLKHPCRRFSDSGAEVIIKFLTVFFGCISIVLAFTCHNLGGIFHLIITIKGATTGPLVGLFFLGIFFPRANKFGAFAGVFGSAAVMLACSIMNNIEKPYHNYMILADTSSNFTGTRCIAYSPEEMAEKLKFQDEYLSKKSADLHFGHPDTSAISRISPFAYTLLGVSLVVVIGIAISYLFPQTLTLQQKRFLDFRMLALIGGGMSGWLIRPQHWTWNLNKN